MAVRHPASPAREPAELWSALSADLRRYVARRVRAEDVEDLLQTVFLRLQQQLPSVRDDERLLSWVYTVTRHVIVDHYRLARHHREVAMAELPPALHPLAEREDADTAEAELAACLRPMLAGLTPEHAAALELVELQGMSQAEAARATGITVSGMKSRVQRGRARLRRLLLECCTVQQDVRGRVQDWAPRDGSCGCS